MTSSPDASPSRTFPDDFLFGVATASYQIEGGAQADGRGPSIWDTFARTPGKVHEQHNGDVACDHYHRWESDLDLMKDLGMQAYRFSVAWPRWQATGSGPINEKGAAWYDRLVDGLLERGIAPWATLYHWDLPQALEDAGGWATRDTAYRFAEYSAAVHARLGDRVAGWITLNEPYCSSFLGYASGYHAPGRYDDKGTIDAVHHLLLGHGLARQAIKEADPSAPVGITLNLYPVDPLDPEDPADRDAARRIDGLQNRIFLDPVLRGTYPEDVKADVAEANDFSCVQPGDLDLIGAPLDFLGVNYYSPITVGAPGHAGADGEGTTINRPGARISQWIGSRDVRFHGRGLPRTQMNWEVYPEGLAEVVLRVLKEYDAPPVYITENGCAYPDEVVDGEVHDVDRTAYLESHLDVLARLVEEGADVRGYFLWSLMDNFEWAWGYSRRFGVVHVDYDTQVRTVKDSGKRYAQIVATRSLQA
ncbi:MAG: GH1 family beta-glucosidase [Kineosporiaceae bacterium]